MPRKPGPTGTGRVNKCVVLTVEQVAEIRAIAQARTLSFSAVVREAVADLLARTERKRVA